MAKVQAAARSRWSDADPLRWIWRGLTSVRFALALIGFLAIASLIGVLVPQLPLEMRGNAAAETAWLNFQRDRFGFLTDSMERLGLFEVFRSVWFISGLALLVASVCVCTANRLPPIWRNALKPQERVPDEYFEREGPAVVLAAPQTESLTAALRHRRYRVSVSGAPNATYLFADRFPWAQFATFVSHLALILFLAGGFVTVLTSRQEQIFVAEGEAGAPVFAPSDRDHMQVYVEDAVGRFDESGFPRDFRTQLVVYKSGREIARGVTTVNRPLSAGGYRFHQAAYFPDGASLQVRDLQTGHLIYNEVLALTSTAATPRIVVRDASGKVLLDDLIVPTDFIGEAAGTVIAVPGTGREFWVGGSPKGDKGTWQLIVFETANPAGARELLSEGEQADLGGISLSFVGVTGVPSSVVKDIPGLPANGVAELSDGPTGPLLTVGPASGRALALSPGQAVAVGDLEYTFMGRREFAGITVRKDPGASFIWVGTGMLLLGLALTFYLPRRRLWVKIAAGQAAFRGLGGRSLAIEREIRETVARATADPPKAGT